MKTIRALFIIAIAAILNGCGSPEPDLTTPCSERKSLFCEDFENVDPQLETSQLVDSTAFDQWWVTSDTDQEYLFPDFPQNARTRTNLIVIGDGQYKNDSASFLYTREIDLSTASTARLSYNLIYRTEKSWDGMIVFAVRGGVQAVGDPGSWVPLTPEGGYPDRVLINGVLVPGYSGISPGWIHQEIDLTSFAGTQVILGYYFTADPYENNWGAALDDIIVDADNGSLANATAGLVDLPLESISFPVDPLISLDLPRANTLSEIPCLSDQEEVLGESQRAVIKAVSQSENFYLILNPNSGSLCWVEDEDVWIDGETGGLPRLAERAVVSYSPIMPYSQTPVVNDPVCGSGLVSDLPLQIDTVLITDGRISTAVFSPIFPGSTLPENFDPRVGDAGEMPATEPGPSPAGKLWIKNNGGVYPCQSDQAQPGRVVCQGLAFEQSQPLGFELCWQGWDQTQSCPYGFYFDPLTSGCVADDGSTACEPACSDGYLMDLEVGACLVDRAPGTVREDPNSCPAGFVFNATAKICVGLDYSPETNCPTETYYEVENGTCLQLEDPDTCPEGYSRSAGTEGCLPDASRALISCQLIEAPLPIQDVTVKNAARCLKDPDNPDEMVSALDPFDKAEILGLGAINETLVILNPTYQIPCWAPLESFYVEKIDLDILPIIYPE